MELMVLSLIINCLLSVYFMAELGDAFGVAIFGVWLFNLITSIIYLSTRNRFLGTLSLIGFALYIPIGLIGVYGVKGIIDDQNRENINNR